MLKASEKKDSDLDIPNQRFTQLHASEESLEGEQDQELLEKDTEKKTENAETNRPSSFGVSGVYDPLPILARGKGFDEEPEAV